jgi:NADPH:quinone reductase-like Zn-dependent oxidoreductase
VYFVVEPNSHQLAQIAGLLDGGWPPPAIDSLFPLEDAASAFERTMAVDKRGKVVLDVARASVG